MAAVVHMTSILLGCWIAEVTYAASLLTAYDKKPSEAWPLWPYPSARSWGHPAASAWQRQGEFSPLLPLNSNAAKNTARGIIPSKKSHTKIEMAKPRTFEIKFQGPMANTEDRKSEHDHSHSHGSSRFHLGSQLESSSRDSLYTGPFKYPDRDPQGSSKPGFHFSLSVPLLTTEAPKLPDSVVDVKDTRFYTGPSHSRFRYPHHMPEVNKPVYQNPTAQKPAESKIVTFLSGLFNQRGQDGQINTHPQQNNVFFKPVAQRHPSAQAGSVSGHHQNPTNYWMGKMHVSSSAEAEGDVQNPSHQAVQNTVHYSPQWFPVPNPTSDSADVRNRILQSAKYVNGQLMIPLEKCPGFERLAAHIQNYHHGYSHHRHNGHSHPSGPMPTKPHYTKFVLNMEGAAPNPNEPTQGTNVQQSGEYHERPVRWWPGTGVNSVSRGAQNQFVNPLPYVQPDSQQAIRKPGHTNYEVELGANIGYDKIPDTQSQNNFRYVVPRRLHAY